MFTGHSVPKRLPAVGGGVFCRLGAHLPPTPFLQTKVLPPEPPEQSEATLPVPVAVSPGSPSMVSVGLVLQIQKYSLVIFFPG